MNWGIGICASECKLWVSHFSPPLTIPQTDKHISVVVKDEKTKICLQHFFLSLLLLLQGLTASKKTQRRQKEGHAKDDEEDSDDGHDGEPM